MKREIEPVRHDVVYDEELRMWTVVRSGEIPSVEGHYSTEEEAEAVARSLSPKEEGDALPKDRR